MTEVVALNLDLDAIKAACSKFGVSRLRIFGSAVTDRFDPESSDVDFLVDFEEERGDLFSDYFGLRESLESIVGRPVDLVFANSIRNPYFAKSAFGSAQGLYAG